MTTVSGIATCKPINRQMIMAPEASGIPNQMEDISMGMVALIAKISDNLELISARKKKVRNTLAIKIRLLLCSADSRPGWFK